MRKDQRRNSDHQQQPELVTREESDEQTSQQQQSERTDEENAADKAPLLADCRKDVVVMHGSRGKKAQFDLRVRRLEAFARPAARADCDEGLIDRPGRALSIDIGINKGGDAFLLVRL